MSGTTNRGEDTIVINGIEIDMAKIARCNMIVIAIW